MAKYGQDQVAMFLVGGYNLLGYQTQIEYRKRKLLEQSDTLGDAWEEQDSVGVERAELTQSGFYDDVAAGNNAAILALAGSFTAGLIGVAGNAYGRKVTMFTGALAALYERLAGRAMLHKANAEYSVSGRVYEGIINAPHAAYALAASPLTAVDNGASSAGGAAAVLEVSALTLGGWTSITAKVRDSVDNISYVDLITFTTTTAAQTSQLGTVAGTVDRYTHVTLTGVGAGAGESITLAVGLSRL